MDYKSKNGNKNTEKPGLFGTLLGYAALLSLAGTFVCGFSMEKLSDMDMEWVLISMFGLTLMLFGLTAAVSAKQYMALVLAGFGALILGAGLVYGFGDRVLQESLVSQVLPVVLLSVFAIAGVCMLVVPPIAHRKKVGKYIKEIDAEIVDKQLHEWMDDIGDERRRHKSFILTWRYYAGGRWITWQSNISRSPEPREIGDRCVLYLNPEDPEDAWDKEADGTGNIILTIMGAGFLLMGGLGLWMFLFLA